MRVYALKNNSKKNSASGGAFPTIIEALQEMGDNKLVVYGAKFDENLQVQHGRGTTQREYAEFQGSKYVESDLKGVFKKVEEDLIANSRVLFSGTPCQISAISKYLSAQNVMTNNLFLVDIICHGTPNVKIWNDFIKWLEKKYKSKVVEFSFRYQYAKWKDYPVRVKFSNGKIVVNSYETRLYMQLFAKRLIMRECCYSCPHARIKRCSDITIGDFWGIKTVMPDFPYNNSVSEVLVNTEKGNQIINHILMEAKTNTNVVIEQCLSDEYIKYQHNLNSATERPYNIEAFKRDYAEYGFDYVIKKYIGYSLLGKVKHCVRKICGEKGISL